jgi:uroporphyrinogen-III synthase
MRALEGLTIALLESRMSGELAEIVRRAGGIPRQVPAVRESVKRSPAEVAHFLDQLASGAVEAVVLLTGAGALALIDEARLQGRLDELLTHLRTVVTVCRGPKPAAVLHRHGVMPSLTAAEPYTSAELLEVMKPLTFNHGRIGLVHYGERDGALVEALSTRVKAIAELCLYEWRLPEDVQLLESLVDDLIAGNCDAVVFTSQIQCRHLFEIAGTSGACERLRAALNERTVVASVGPVCSAALVRFGVVPDVTPDRPKMAPLMTALGDFFLKNRGFEKGPGR